MDNDDDACALAPMCNKGAYLYDIRSGGEGGPPKADKRDEVA